MTAEWDRVPWERFGEDSKNLGFCKRRLPFKNGANVLQTLDLWLTASGKNTLPESHEWPAKPTDGIWVIYIHGGAWRDPNITAASFDSPVEHLLGSASPVKGFASLSYSLAVHPDHPDNPSPPKDSSKPKDPSRMATHPQHILDVLEALESLQKKVQFGNNYLLLGHSCGATLAFQTVMDRRLWGAGGLSIPKAKYVLGLNGLYDLPELIRSPGAKHEHLIPVYDSFTNHAFTDDKEVWKQVSPAYVGDWSSTWPEGEMAILVQSKEDSLVPYSQTRDMKIALQRSASKGLDVREYEAGGDHNAPWQDGAQLAEIIQDIIAIVQEK